MKVLPTRLVLKPLPDVEYERNGIIVPGVSKEAPGRAEIIEAGPDCFCKPGEIVLYNKGAAVALDTKNGSFITMIETPNNIITILEPADL